MTSKSYYYPVLRINVKLKRVQITHDAQAVKIYSDTTFLKFLVIVTKILTIVFKKTKKTNEQTKID